MPSYLSIGVTFENFMESCPKDLEPYIKANEIKLQTENMMLYINGMYVMDAITASIGNSHWFKGKGQPEFKYPDRPYDVFGESEEEKEKEKQRDLDEFIAQEKARRANWHMRHAREEQN